MSEPTILSGKTAVGAQLWSAPSLDAGAAPDTGAARQWLPLGDLALQEDSFFEQARADGYAKGVAEAQVEIAARERRLDAQAQVLESTLTALARPLTVLSQQMQEQMTELAIQIARQLLRRELKTDPSQVIAVVRETVALLPAAARGVRVSLHPEDAALLRARLATPQAESAWTILEDPVMSRGGCRVTADAAQIDARIETRIAAVMAALLGDERAKERTEAQVGDPK